MKWISPTSSKSPVSIPSTNKFEILPEKFVKLVKITSFRQIFLGSILFAKVLQIFPKYGKIFLSRKILLAKKMHFYLER